MNIIYVDDEYYILKHFEMVIKDLPMINLKGLFDDAREALEYARNNHVDAAFLDIAMPGITGLELAERLRQINPEIVLIFVSAHEKYVKEALFDRKADYYLLKPYSTEDILSAIERASLLSRRQQNRVRIETFGRFNVYVGDTQVDFTSKRAKEVFAVIVDRRGTSVDIRTIWNTVFEEDEYDHTRASTLRRTIIRMRAILEGAGIGDILISNRGEYRIDPEKVDCDYYNFLKGDKAAIDSFFGEYMADYSWAESTLGVLVGMCPKDHKIYMMTEV